MSAGFYNRRGDGIGIEVLFYRLTGPFVVDRNQKGLRSGIPKGYCSGEITQQKDVHIVEQKSSAQQLSHLCILSLIHKGCILGRCSPNFGRPNRGPAPRGSFPFGFAHERQEMTETVLSLNGRFDVAIFVRGAGRLISRLMSAKLEEDRELDIYKLARTKQ